MRNLVKIGWAVGKLCVEQRNRHKFINIYLDIINKNSVKLQHKLIFWRLFYLFCIKSSKIFSSPCPAAFPLVSLISLLLLILNNYCLDTLWEMPDDALRKPRPKHCNTENNRLKLKSQKTKSNTISSILYHFFLSLSLPYFFIP